MTTRMSVWLTAVAAVAFLAPAAVRADAIDEVMIEKADKVMKYLKEHNYKNVGVLKFEVQRHGLQGPTSMSAGRLNVLMGTKLENALIMVNNTKNPIGVTRDAGEFASNKDHKINYHTADGRKRLFALNYPLAWGTQTVPVDVFLTGRVTISPDYKTSTVYLRLFDKKMPEIKTLLKFNAPVDTALLADIEQPFVISKRSYKDLSAKIKIKRRSMEDVILEEAQETAAKADQTAQNPAPAGNISLQAPLPNATPIKTELDQYLKFDVYYNGLLVQWTSPNVIPTPQVGDKIHFVVKANERIAVVLRVNGINTTDNDRVEKEVDQYNKWVLEPGKEYHIRGFYTQDNQVALFVAKDANNTLPDELGSEVLRHGKIDIDVWKEANAVAEALGEPKIQIATRSNKVTLRSVASRGKDLASLQNTITNAATAKVKTRNFIVGGERENAVLETATFQGVPAARMTVEYFQPNRQNNGGVLSPDNQGGAPTGGQGTPPGGQ